MPLTKLEKAARDEIEKNREKEAVKSRLKRKMQIGPKDPEPEFLNVKKGGKIKKAKSGKYFDMLGVKPTVNKKTMEPKPIDTQVGKSKKRMMNKAGRATLGLKGGGAAIRGTNFKGVF